MEYNIAMEIERSSKQIVTFAITGGPCGGKTSVENKLKRITSVLSGKVLFIFVPEAATILNKGNMTFENAGSDNTFQEQILNLQIQLELSAHIIARKFLKDHPDMKVAIICDRGLMDGAAYYDNPEDFERLLLSLGITVEEAFKRYDVVLHLVTAAIGAPDFYTTSDGTPRSETPEKAAILDRNCEAAWASHPCVIKFPNCFKFNEKLEHVVSVIFRVMGVEMPSKICKRYIVNIPNIFSLHDDTTCLEVFRDKTFFIKQKRTDLYEAVKVRSVGNNNTYFLNTQRWEIVCNPDTGEKSVEAVFDTTEAINQGTMTGYINKVDTTIPPIEKITYQFCISEEVYCEMEVYKCNQQNAYLRAYFDCDECDIEKYIPQVEQFFTIIREVEYSKEYSEYGIASTHGKILN